MTALKTIYVIDGKPSCSGQALLALMRKGGMEVEIPDPGTVTTSATVKVKRPGGNWKTFTYTQAMAEAAGLWNSKGNWKKHPAEMLIWRAVSTAARFEGSDIVGALYTTEELQPDRPVNENGDPLDMPMITANAPAPEAPGSNPENGEPEASPEATKSEPVSTGETGSVPADDAPAPGAPEAVDMPADLFQKLMKDKDISAAGKVSQERAATIRKLWAEGAITADQDEFDRVLVVIERLQSHRKGGGS